MNFSQLTLAQLHFEITALQAEYADVIDDDRLEDWPALFTEACLYQVIARENADRGLGVAAILCTSRAMLVDRVVSLRRANIYPLRHHRHILSTARITAVADDLVEAQTSYLVLQTRADGATEIYNAGKYQDEIVFADGRLRYSRKVAIFDTNRVDTLMVTPI
jgi:anthranilate 1,2-dioxygenase small subunit